MKAKQIRSMILGCAVVATAVPGCSLEDHIATPDDVVTSEDVAAITTFASTVVAQNSGRCMDVFGAQTGNDVNLIQWGCHGGTNQSFTFTPVAGTTDTYTINTFAGRCADVANGSTADNTRVIQNTCNGATSQRFRLAPVSIVGTDKTFNLRAVHSNKCIGVTGASTTNGAQLLQVPCSTAADRVFRVPSHTLGTAGLTFTNPIRQRGPDPFMTFFNGNYYLVTTTWNNTITMRRSSTLAGISTTPDTVIFNLSSLPNGCCNMWAPEIHLLNGPSGQRWYLYYTASRNVGNYLPTQRIHVLESAGLDPMGPYTFKADLVDPTNNNPGTWELDATILQLNGRLFLLGTYFEGTQPMFIREMSNPFTALGTRRRLSTPTFSWETVGGAVNEGPEVIQRNGQTFIVFSASHCSTPDYKLGLLTYNGGDPLSQSSWVKSPNPIFTRNDAGRTFGPGHHSFFKSPDGTEDWIVYHANDAINEGCDINRETRAQKINWNANNTPNFGVPAARGTVLTSPSGEQ
jgi:GH43 family beta-xylosidase